MKRRSLILFLLALVCLPLSAQQMSVEGFTRLKGSKVEKDKSMAILDLVTEESGFTVVCGQNQPVEVKQGEGIITLRLPHKTSRLSIRHPEYGQLSWQAPTPLKKKRHYRATLFAVDPTKELKGTHQWVMFHLAPDNILLQIDSVSHPVRSDMMAYYLPLGEHRYRAEAPFYAPQEGQFTLTDSLRAEVLVNLQPLYSFLTVKTDWKGGGLYIDGTPVRREEVATSCRLNEGYHRVAFFWGRECFYDSLLFVGPAQKVVLELTEKDLRPLPLRMDEPLQLDSLALARLDTDSVRVPVSLRCKDPEAEILVDRESVGKGQWEGSLPLGFHLLNARKSGCEGPVQRLMLEDAFPQELVLMAPGSGLGLVNIYTNAKDARIRIDGEDRGAAPEILELDASRSYEVMVYGPGYKEKKCRVRPKAGAQVDVYLKLKKR